MNADTRSIYPYLKYKRGVGYWRQLISRDDYKFSGGCQ